jgi:hypothetical protein
MKPSDSARLAHALLLIFSAVTIAYALGVVVFGVIDLITQLAGGSIRMTMYWSADQYRFTDTGDGRSGVEISGGIGPAETAISGITGGTVAIHIAATVVGLLAQLSVGIVAIRLLGRLRAGRPFDRSAWREIALASAVVLSLGIAYQLLTWWARAAVVADSGGGTFSTAFVFDPLTVTIGLALAIVAVAFRSGERLQRETDGLV